MQAKPVQRCLPPGICMKAPAGSSVSLSSKHTRQKDSDGFTHLSAEELAASWEKARLPSLLLATTLTCLATRDFY